MLVLSRAVNEEIIIDRSIRVKVLKGGQGRVHLGISAPREVPVRRAELPPGEPLECPTHAASGTRRSTTK